MKVKLFNNKGIWSIVAKEDPFFGEELGEAEALGLRRVNLLANGSLTAGEITASYGLTISEVVFSNPHLVREVGVNRTFRPCDQALFYDISQSAWFDLKTGAKVEYARFVTVLGRHVYYSDTMPYPSEYQTNLPALNQPSEARLNPSDAPQEEERKDGILSRLLRR